MAISSQRVTVNTSATALNTASTAGQTLTIKNGAAIIDLFGICATSSVVEVLRT